MLSSLAMHDPLYQHSTVTQRGLNPDYASTFNYASIITQLLLKKVVYTEAKTSLSGCQG